MNKLGTWSVAVAAVSAIVNLVLFFLWFNIVKIEAVAPKSNGSYTIDVLALNITILQTVMGVVGVLFAVLGVFGYVEIKNAAISRAQEAAEKEAKKVANEQMTIFIGQQAEKLHGLKASESRSPVEPTIGITEAQGE